MSPSETATALAKITEPSMEKSSVILPEDVTLNPDMSVTGIVSSRLLKMIAIAAGSFVALKLINTAFTNSETECYSEEDCRRIRKLNTVETVIRSTMNVIVPVLAVVGIMNVSGIDVRAILITAGVMGIVIGLAVQPSLRSMISGLRIITHDRMAVGDYVRVTINPSGTQLQGFVTALTSMNATLQDVTGKTSYLENGDIALVENMSQAPQRVQVLLYVNSSVDVDVLLAALRQTASEISMQKEVREKVTQDAVVQGITEDDGIWQVVSVVATAKVGMQNAVHFHILRSMLRTMQKMGVRDTILAYNNAKLEEYIRTHNLTTDELDAAIRIPYASAVSSKPACDNVMLHK